MAREIEQDVAQHYGRAGLRQTILDALAAAGLDPQRLRPEDLAPIDEFHVGGRAATKHAVAKMGLTPAAHVLDVGCGLGGASRYMAAAFGCRVTGIDLTPEYVEVARMLVEGTGLSRRVDYRAASALAMPFADAAFDAVVTLHVAMNIQDRAGLYREVARVLKPGAVFCIYDVMQGNRDGLQFPVPWADTPATSHLTTPAEMHTLLADAGFEAMATEDRTAFGIAFFRERLAAMADGPPPALGLHLLMGSTARAKFQNMLANLESGAVAAVEMIVRRAA